MPKMNEIKPYSMMYNAKSLGNVDNEIMVIKTLKMIINTKTAYFKFNKLQEQQDLINYTPRDFHRFNPRLYNGKRLKAKGNIANDRRTSEI